MREAENLPYYERTPSGLNVRLLKLEKRVAELEMVLDRIASGFWNETECHKIARAAVDAK